MNSIVHLLFNSKWIVNVSYWSAGEPDISDVHTDKSFRNLIKSNRNQIVITIFQWIWNQTNLCLVPNPSEMVNTTWFQFDLRRFLKDSSVCAGKCVSMTRVSYWRKLMSVWHACHTDANWCQLQTDVTPRLLFFAKSQRKLLWKQINRFYFREQVLLINLFVFLQWKVIFWHLTHGISPNIYIYICICGQQIIY